VGHSSLHGREKDVLRSRMAVVSRPKLDLRISQVQNAISLSQTWQMLATNRVYIFNPNFISSFNLMVT
jgi:hypothetical protein